MTLGKHQETFSKDVSKLFNYILDNGYDIRIGEALRTKEQQKIYILSHKTKTYNSMHLKKCAIDLFIFKNGIWIKSKDLLQQIGDYWESLNTLNRWGGNYKTFIDTVHFERKC